MKKLNEDYKTIKTIIRVMLNYQPQAKSCVITGCRWKVLHTVTKKKKKSDLIRSENYLNPTKDE